MRCCKTWNEAIGTPNCLRVLRYSSVASLALFIAPTASAHSSAVAKSTASSISGIAPCSGPSKSPSPTRTATSRTSAARWPSTVRLGLSVTPAAFGSTRNRLTPAASAPLRAETINRWAVAAPITTHFSPFNTQPLPSACAVLLLGLRSYRPAGSSPAKASCTEPSINPGNSAARWAAEPARDTSRPPRPMVSSSGSTTSASPQASIAAIKSSAPPPKPPSASASVIAVRPISAKVDQTAALWPVADCRISLRLSKVYSLARNFWIESASCCCSSLSSKFMFCPRGVSQRRAAPS